MTDTPKKRGRRNEIADGLKRGTDAEQRALELRFNRADKLLAGGRGEPEEPTAEPKATKPGGSATGNVEKFAVSMAPGDGDRIEALLLCAARAGLRINRSHLFRVAIKVLEELPEEEFLEAVRSVERLKPGRR